MNHVAFKGIVWGPVRTLQLTCLSKHIITLNITSEVALKTIHLSHHKNWKSVLCVCMHPVCICFPMMPRLVFLKWCNFIWLFLCNVYYYDLSLLWICFWLCSKDSLLHVFLNFICCFVPLATKCFHWGAGYPVKLLRIVFSLPHSYTFELNKFHSYYYC